MFLWFGFVQGECRGRHTFWAHRGGGLRIPEPGRHTIEPFRGKFTKKFSIVKYKYQQICMKSIIFTPTEYKTTNSGGHGTYFREGNFPPKPPYTARNFRQDTGPGTRNAGASVEGAGQNSGRNGKKCRGKTEKCNKNPKKRRGIYLFRGTFPGHPGQGSNKSRTCKAGSINWLVLILR